MKILFVWPNRDQFGFKPMGIAMLSALLKQNGHDVDLFDTTFFDLGFTGTTEARNALRIFKPVDWSRHNVYKQETSLHYQLTKKLLSFQPDIIAVSALSDEVDLALNICSIIKFINSEIPIIWGGKAVTMNPKRILMHNTVDYACIGEGIDCLPYFVELIANGETPIYIPNLAYRIDINKYQMNPMAPYFRYLDALPFLDWSLFDDRHFLKAYDGKIYRGGDHMIYWGCPNECTYCINTAYRELYQNETNFLRHPSVEKIIKELEFLTETYDLNFFKFHDEDFCLKPIKFFRDLAAAYKKRLGVPFTAMANCKNLTEEKVALLKDMGCVSVSVGIETGNEELRKNILKRRETKEDIITGVKRLNSAGIRSSAFNLLGIPGETTETIMETVELNRLAEVRYPNVGFFFPLDNTELKQYSIDNDMYSEKKGAKYSNTNPCLTLDTISEEELIAMRERFILYIKLPLKYRRYIDRSKIKDNCGAILLNSLRKIYDETIFKNEGIWIDIDDTVYIQSLNQIIATYAK